MLVRRLRASVWGELPRERQALHAWAGWKVRQILQELERERLALLASEELVARIRQERKEARKAWQEVRAGVAHNANHSNWPGGLITHPEGSLEIGAVPEVSAAERSGNPERTPSGLQTHKGSRSSSLLGRPRLLNAF